MSHLRRLVPALVLAGGMCLAGGAPAFAAGAPGHAVLAAVIVVPTNESSPIEFSGECESAADQAELHWAGPSDSGYYDVAVSANQEIAETESADQFGAPGEIVTFTLRCFTGTTPLASVDTELTLPDAGSTISMATTFTANEPLTLSGTCGVTGATQVFVLWAADGDPLQTVILPLTTAAWSVTEAPTAASLGIPVGASAVAQAYCLSGESERADPLSGRSTSFTVAADAVVVPPVTMPEAAPVPTLAETGMDAAAPLALGSALLLGGALLLSGRLLGGGPALRGTGALWWRRFAGRAGR